MLFSKIKLVFVFALVGLIYISCSKNKTGDSVPVIVNRQHKVDKI